QRPRLCGASRRTGARPAVIPMPPVGARLISQHMRRIGPWTVLQIVVEEWLHDRPAKPGRRVPFKLNRPVTPTLAATLAMVPRPLAPPLAMVPGPQDEVDPLPAGIAGGERLVQGGSAVNVLLIEQPGDDEHCHLRWILRQELVERLLLPEAVIGRMCRELAPE